ncbi:MAG TPA: DUF4339 domain-containing protein [Vicinamibacteria bacterium]
MTRERWFYAPTHKRHGPIPLAQLVEGLLRLPDPRSCLVWKHGLPAWTPAGDVEDVDRHLAPFVTARRSAPRADRGPEIQRESVQEAADQQARVRSASRAQAAAGPSSLVYAGAGAGLLVLGAVVWLFWPKAPAPRPKAAGSGSSAGLITLKDGDPSTSPAEGGPRATPGQSGFAGWSEQEGSLPAAELAKLKGVAGWVGRDLEMTVYNGGSWQITELLVRPRRLVKDNFVEDERPLTLLPVGAQMDQGVGKLMDKVAASRKKAVVPLDTGKFSGVAGDRPEAFGATIVGAKGYPPK